MESFSQRLGLASANIDPAITIWEEAPSALRELLIELIQKIDPFLNVVPDRVYKDDSVEELPSFTDWVMGACRTNLEVYPRL